MWIYWWWWFITPEIFCINRPFKKFLFLFCFLLLLLVWRYNFISQKDTCGSSGIWILTVEGVWKSVIKYNGRGKQPSSFCGCWYCISSNFQPTCITIIATIISCSWVLTSFLIKTIKTSSIRDILNGQTSSSIWNSLETNTKPRRDEESIAYGPVARSVVVILCI